MIHLTAVALPRCLEPTVPLGAYHMAEFVLVMVCAFTGQVYSLLHDQGSALKVVGLGRVCNSRPKGPKKTNLCIACSHCLKDL